MKVIGIMVWYDESPTWLAGAVSSVAPVLDHLVAVDGAYVLFPGALDRPSSPPEQADAVLQTCVGLGLPVTIHRPTEPFEGNEVEKRNLSLDLALAHSDSDEDWLLVFDADQVCTRRSEDLREQLHELGKEYAVLQYAVTDRVDTQKLVDEHENLGTETDWSTDGLIRVRGLYSAIPGLRYGPAHYAISAPDEDGGTFWLWGEPNIHQPFAAAGDVSDYLRFDHRNKDREKNRFDRAWDYYRMRDALGIESMVEVKMEAPDGTWQKVVNT